MSRKRKNETPLDLLEAARAACEPPSWYQLARRFKVSTAVIATWRKRGGTYDDEAACDIATMLGMNLSDVIAIREVEHARSEEKRRRWRARLGRAAMMLYSALLAACLWHSGDASATSPRSSCSPLWLASQQPTTPNSAKYLTKVQIMRA